jgi:arginine N-succinyltransferase
MLVVRAITEHDLDGLMALTKLVGSGMTTLKPERDMLAQRVATACASFSEELAPERRDYVFVMEDTSIGKLVGVSAIKAAVGLDETFYNYRIGTLVHSSKELKLFSRMDTLYLSNDLTGCAELCSLFLHPEYRHGVNGKLLSKSRFMFIAQFPQLFSEKLIAEMRGYLDADGRSPFWDSLGRHFFQMDFSRADDLTSLGKKSFIAELMPRHPLYVAYLTPEAQEVIGRTHVDTAPARRLLEQEGMHCEGYVDIFDAGPVLQARVSELRAVRESELVKVIPGTAEGEGMALISGTAMQDFRVIAAPAEPEQGCLTLSEQQRRLLACSEGELVRTMPLNARKASHG